MESISLETVFPVLGAVCIIASIIGGGVGAFGITVPVINTLSRQVLLGVFGLALVLIGYLGPESLTSETDHKNSVYYVRVTVVGLGGVPTDDAHVWSSLGGEPKRVEGGWQFDIPAQSLSADSTLTLFAEHEWNFSKAEKDIKLKAGHSVSETLRLRRDTSAEVGGVVLAEETRVSVSGVRVSVAGHPDEAVITGEGGGFRLPAHAADGEQVRLRAEKEGYHAESLWHPAGEDPATIVLRSTGP